MAPKKTADYGATKDKEEKTPWEQGRAWEDRGSILGLLIDVGGGSVSQILMLLPMITNSLKKSGNFISCNTTLHPSLRTPGLVSLCEYLTAFALAFPCLALTGVMLFIGRNLIQKRFYYSMLKSNGVVSFTQNNPLKESVFWVILICYLHCLGYFFMVLYVCDQEGKFAITTDGIKMGSNEALMLGSCFSLLLLPGALFTLFFYGSYDIEGSLVPLSQYVHDAEEAFEKFKIKGNLSTLSTLDDNYAKIVLKEQQAEFLVQDSGYEDKCDKIKDIVLREKPELEQRPRQNISLFHSFWPGEMLLKPTCVGEAEEYFKTLWFTIVSIFMVVFVGVIVFLCVMVGVDFYRVVMDGDFHVLASSVVLFLHLILVLGFTWPFFESITWRWAAVPAIKLSTHMHEA